MEHYKLFIDGEFVEAANGNVFETIDPGTGVSFARSPRPARRMRKQLLPQPEDHLTAASGAILALLPVPIRSMILPIRWLSLHCS